MKNFVFIVGVCVFVLGLVMSACKSKSLTKSETSETVITGGNSDTGGFTKIDENLVEKKWKLIEINGVALSSMNPQPAIEAFIIFQVNGNRVNGNSGCNNFAGTYKLGPGVALHFSGVASTRKMCIDMSIENQMNQLFQTVDSYSLQDNILSLNHADTPLARFEINE